TYGPLYDGSVETRAALNEGLRRRDQLAIDDALFNDATIAPTDRRAWSADDLRRHLFQRRHDLIYLAGHFSAEGAAAARWEPGSREFILASEILRSNVNMVNSIVFSSGCHAGYNVVNEHEYRTINLQPDWAQAFANKGAVLVAGTGFQYGDTKGTEYGERLYLDFARQLRQSSVGNPVSAGEALVRAKLLFLKTVLKSTDGVYKKQFLVSTIFGLPMLSVEFPGTPPALPDYPD